MDVAEIGLAVIHPFDLSDIEQPPKTIQQLQSQISVTTYSIKISGREQGKGREKFTAQNNKVVKADELEDVLVEILRSFRDTLAGAMSKASASDDVTVPSLVLIGFDLSFELRSMSASYSRIADYFTSWVDLQELVKDAAQLRLSPSMRDSLMALGFGSSYPDIGTPQTKHSAAMDTLRIAAILCQSILTQR